MTTERTLGAILFEDFELLDLYGPLEMFGCVGPELRIAMIAENAGPVGSAQGPKSVADYSFDNAPDIQLLLLPGGIGTFEQATNFAMLDFLRNNAGIETVMSVCSGSGVLAHAGLLDHRKATSNKLFFDAITADMPEVDWQRTARWVEDGNIFTSSGVSAGTDMALAVIAKLYGESRAREVAIMTEYGWQSDAANDPFAAYINEGNLEEYMRLIGRA